MNTVFENTGTTTVSLGGDLSPALDFAGKNPLSDMVEEFVELHNRLAPELDRYESLKKQLGAEVALDKSNLPVTLVGYTHVIDYTAPSESLVLRGDAKDYFEVTGDWSSMTVSVTNARKALLPHVLEDLFEKKLGSRRFRRVR
jgi:hypothetical protein